MPMPIKRDIDRTGQTGIRYCHGGESRGMNDRVHGISCRFSDKTGKDIGYIFLNTLSIFMQLSAHTFALFVANTHLRIVPLCA